MTLRNGMILAGMATTLVLGACGKDTDESPTATPEPTEAADGTVAITFKIDTSTMADGTNKMAEILAGEAAYIVGDLEGGCDYANDPDNNCWKPNQAQHKMTDEGNGIWAITLDLVPGTVLQYKYTKTPVDDTSDNAWSNGPKYYRAPEGSEVCGGDSEAAMGLWEWTENLSYTVPTSDATVDTVTIDAWRDYAHNTFGVAICS